MPEDPVTKPKGKKAKDLPPEEVVPVDNTVRVNGVLKDLKDRFPGALIGFLRDPEIRKNVEYEKDPTGQEALDADLGGGVPRGKLTVMYGPKQSGKTALAYHTMAIFLQDNPDKYALIVDSENACDLEWMKKLGIDVDRVVFIKLGTLEDQTNQVIYSIDQLGDLVGFLLLDSVGAMVPRAEYSGSMKDKKTEDQSVEGFDMNNNTMAVVARKLGQFLRSLNPLISKHKITTVAIAHVYQDLGSPAGGQKMKGGNALEHFAHVKLKLFPMRDKIFEEEVLCPDGENRVLRTGFWCVIEIEKTRQSQHQGSIIKLPFKFGLGFDSDRALINSAVGYGIVKKGGSWYSFGEQQIGQGLASVLDRIKADKELKEAIRARLMSVLAEKETFTGAT